MDGVSSDNDKKQQARISEWWEGDTSPAFKNENVFEQVICPRYASVESQMTQNAFRHLLYPLLYPQNMIF